MARNWNSTDIVAVPVAEQSQKWSGTPVMGLLYQKMLLRTSPWLPWLLYLTVVSNCFIIITFLKSSLDSAVIATTDFTVCRIIFSDEQYPYRQLSWPYWLGWFFSAITSSAKLPLPKSWITFRCECILRNNEIQCQKRFNIVCLVLLPGSAAEQSLS